MAMSQQEATAALVKTNEILVKVSNETDALLEQIDKLEDGVVAGDTVTPELEAAVKATAQRAHAIDELVQDTPQPEA